MVDGGVDVVPAGVVVVVVVGVVVVVVVVVVVGEIVVGASVLLGNARVVGAADGAPLATGATVGIDTTTTIDGGGALGPGVAVGGTAVEEPNAADGIFDSASFNFSSRSPTLDFKSLASATATSRLSRSAERRSDERMFSDTPTRVTTADRIAPARMACAGLSGFSGLGSGTTCSSAGSSRMVSSALTIRHRTFW